MAKITPRMEKRQKWLEERKNLSRVTRARTAQESASSSSSSKSVPISSSSSTTSSNESKSKHSPSHGNKTKYGRQPPVLSKQTDIKSSSNSKPPAKKPKLVRNGDIPVEESSNGAKDKAAAAKKGKIHHVDAVDKLESSPSIHVPKKLVLFVGNLPEDITKEQVMNHFRRTGGVKSVKIPKYRGTETGKGFAYVEFNNTISHRLALRLNNTTLADRKIIVEFTSEGKMTEKQLNEKLKQKTDGESTLKMPFDT